MNHRIRRGFTVIELMVVVVVLAALVAILLPVLSTARKSAMVAKINSESQYGAGRQMALSNMQQAADAPAAQSVAGAPAPPSRPLARVKGFDAKISLTPRLSVGTTDPESIYEAKFSAQLNAVAPAKDSGDCEIELPLPPEIISLTELSVTANGEPSDMVAMRNNKLVWRGALKDEPTKLEVTYTAVGKGLYALDIPPGGILDTFNIALQAHGSDVRMLELSLQPTSVSRESGVTNYTWAYKRLMFGRPISLDVLGIAPIDKLGELSWLGPISVVVFGLIIGLVTMAYPVARFDRWMLLLILGMFTGAYPLMYFAQEFVSPSVAILAPAGLVLLVILVRTVTTMSWRSAIFGIVIPGGAVMAITLVAATQPSLQGLLLTIEAIGFFIIAMALMPKKPVEKRIDAGPLTGLAGAAV